MKETILLVEDEENDIFFMKRALQHAGVTQELQVVRDGQAAIDYLRHAIYGSHGQLSLPRLVLLDLKLPQVMGMEVLQWIRQQHELQTMIVIVFTSSRMQSDIDAAYRSGANSYLVKPGSSDQLLKIARLIKEYWLNINQSAPESTEPIIEKAGKDWIAIR